MNGEIIKELIKPIRERMPRYGGEKLHLDVKGDLVKNNIKMGRDGFCRFLKNNHLLVPKTKRCFITTDSNHFYPKSPNLIKDLVPTHAEQVFVSDITYIQLEDRHAYLALVTDWYTKRIMGYKIDDNMKVGLVKDALQMAVNNRIYDHPNVIHHSDRGLQYCCPDYTEFAKRRGMVMSTTEKYDPYENAAAERVNGILKYEFGLIRTIPTLDIAEKMLKESVDIYNNERRHCSLGMQTPNFAHIHQEHKHVFYRKKRRSRNVDKVQKIH